MILNFIQSATKQFEYYKHLGDRTFDQLQGQEVFYNIDPESNSIAIIVHHMSGNMLSRWTDFLTTDGEKPWRSRESEFQNPYLSTDQMLEAWDAGWQCLFTALESINVTNFESTIYIRNQKHTIVDAIHRQMMHYAYHVGQIVYIGKVIKGERWKSLSIPKGQSKLYNQEKMQKGKHDGHFTDEFVNR